MNKSMILNLVEDGKCYFDNIHLYENKEFKKNSDEIQEMLEKFCEGMSEKEKFDAIWKFDLVYGKLEAITADEYFKEGFKLGLIIGAQNFLD